MTYHFLGLLLMIPAHAAVLIPGSSYPVKKELTAAAPGASSPESFYTEMQMDFESFDANNPGAPAVMGTHTDQLMKVKKLSKVGAKDPAFAKDGFNDRSEFTFEKLVNVSRVSVPGMTAPFETRADLGAILSDKPLQIRGDGKNSRKIDNLEEVKRAALAQTKDLISRTTLSTVLREDLMLKATASAGPETSCLGALAGKKPGEKWKFSTVEQGITLSFDCSFEGWSEAKGKKIAVIHTHSTKQRMEKVMPNGNPGIAETEGDGVIYFEPGGPETLQQTTMHVLVEPAEAEVARMKARGQTVPRNRSEMLLRNHVFPL